MINKLIITPDETILLLKKLLAGVITFYTSHFMPVNDFFLAIMILASLNIVFGWIADTAGWSFRKAFRAFLYLIGYLLLLALSLIVGKLMHIDLEEIVGFTSWVTWVMIYFYAVNILRNWTTIQPQNKAIGFLYWVATFKILEKIKYLKEYNEHQKTNEK